MTASKGSTGFSIGNRAWRITSSLIAVLVVAMVFAPFVRAQGRAAVVTAADTIGVEPVQPDLANEQRLHDEQAVRRDVEARSQAGFLDGAEAVPAPVPREGMRSRGGNPRQGVIPDAEAR